MSHDIRARGHAQRHTRRQAVLIERQAAELAEHREVFVAALDQLRVNMAVLRGQFETVTERPRLRVIEGGAQ